MKKKKENKGWTLQQTECAKKESSQSKCRQDNFQSNLVVSNIYIYIYFLDLFVRENCIMTAVHLEVDFFFCICQISSRPLTTRNLLEFHEFRRSRREIAETFRDGV